MWCLIYILPGIQAHTKNLNRLFFEELDKQGGKNPQDSQDGLFNRQSQ